MNETVKKPESKVKSFIKSILTIILVILLFNAVQGFVMGVYMGLDIANKVVDGELPSDYLAYPDELEAAFMSALEKAAEKAIEISLVSNLITILILCLSYTFRRRSPAEGMDIKSIGFVRCISVFIFGMALQMIVSLLMAFIPIPEEILNEHNIAYESIGLSSNLLLQIFSVGIVTGIVEELIFRGIITKHLRKYMHPAIAVVISSVLFGLMHPSIISMVYATILGLVLGALYVKYDSVLPSILCHIAFNSMSCVLSLLSEDTAFILLLLMGVSIPVIIYLTKSIFFRYPTAGDLLFDDKGRIKPRNPAEAEVISRLKVLKESGQITEKDFKRIDQDWERAKKWKKSDEVPTTVETEITVTENTVDPAPEQQNTDENKGENNTDETL